MVQKAKDAISEIFRDTSLSPEETKEALTEIQEECEIRIDTIKEDIESEGLG